MRSSSSVHERVMFFRVGLHPSRCGWWTQCVSFFVQLQHPGSLFSWRRDLQRLKKFMKKRDEAGRKSRGGRLKLCHLSPLQKSVVVKWAETIAAAKQSKQMTEGVQSQQTHCVVLSYGALARSFIHWVFRLQWVSPPIE